MTTPPPLPLHLRNEKVIYVLIDGSAHGPFSNIEIASMQERGEISPDSLAWRENLSEWQPLKFLNSDPISKKIDLKFVGNIIFSILAVCSPFYVLNVYLNDSWKNNRHAKNAVVFLLIMIFLFMKELVVFLNKNKNSNASLIDKLKLFSKEILHKSKFF